MRNSIIPAFLSALALSACATSVIEDGERPVPEDAAAFTGTRSMEVDESQSYISFMGNSNLVDHEGKFNDFDVTITPDAADPSNFEGARVEATIDIASVETDSDGLTGHLQRDDFFAAEAHPQATFTSTSIVSKGGNAYDVTGDLTIKGVTKTATLAAEVTDAWLTATYDLPRREFGIGNDSYGDKLLEETVPVDVKIVFAE
jgi:polyisoprenoid-binding protein YceI